MPHYENACIYKIKHNEDYNDENIYIGSTCNLIRRRCQHKDCCNKENNKEYNKPLYQYIRENGGWDNYIMIKIHDYKCNSKSELKIEERKMIDMLKPKLNKNIPTRSKKEYYEENKEHLVEKNKEWYEANKELLAEKKKKKYEANKQDINEKRKEKYKCDICGAEITKGHLARHKKTQKCLSVKNNV